MFLVAFNFRRGVFDAVSSAQIVLWCSLVLR